MGPGEGQRQALRLQDEGRHPQGVLAVGVLQAVVTLRILNESYRQRMRAQEPATRNPVPLRLL